MSKFNTRSKLNYNEENVESIYPIWNKKVFSIYSMTSAEGLTVVDTQIKSRKFFNKWKK